MTVAYRALIKLHRLSWYLFNRRRFKSLGVNSIFLSPLKITKQYITCGRNVFVYKHARVEGISEYNTARFAPTIIIEDGVSIQQNLHLTCAQEVVIGENTAIAANVTITDIHHCYTDISVAIEKQDIIVNPVRIGADSKIYNNAVILPGTIIGKHVTVGANSVVSGKVADFSVIVGIPGRIVKIYDTQQNRWCRTGNNSNRD